MSSFTNNSVKYYKKPFNESNDGFHFVKVDETESKRGMSVSLGEYTNMISVGSQGVYSGFTLCDESEFIEALERALSRINDLIPAYA